MVIASGNALRQGTRRVPNTFQLCVSKSDDISRIGISIVGPGKPDIWTQTYSDRTVQVSYRILQIGRYKVHITYDGEDIVGSPYHLIVRS